jgi:hypothetical protein
VLRLRRHHRVLVLVVRLLLLLLVVEVVAMTLAKPISICLTICLAMTTVVLQHLRWWSQRNLRLFVCRPSRRL